MLETDPSLELARLTARGVETRDRILHAAADLMRAKGVAATTLDEVRAASGTSKSQLYRHFANKDALIHAVIAIQADGVLESQRQQLRRLSSLRGLQRWRDSTVQRLKLTRGAHGCAIGSLASELADHDEVARAALAMHFADWQGLLVAGLERMRSTGVLRDDADPIRLATGIMAALQGGYLLAQLARSAAPMETALDMALDQVRAYGTGAAGLG